MHIERIELPSLPCEGVAIRLRAFERQDLESYRHWMQPHHEWHLWDGPYYPRPTAEEIDRAIEALTARIEAQEAQEAQEATASQPWQQPGIAPLPPHKLVIARVSDNSMVGTVGWYWESEETQWARMGITVFDPQVRGQGVGTEALKLWTTFLFGATPWVRLDYATWSGNHAMVSVGRKLGFVEEARFRNARIVRGEYFDSVVYGILREEWESRGLFLT